MIVGVYALDLRGLECIYAATHTRLATLCLNLRLRKNFCNSHECQVCGRQLLKKNSTYYLGGKRFFKYVLEQLKKEQKNYHLFRVYYVSVTILRALSTFLNLQQLTTLYRRRKYAPFVDEKK